MDVKEFLKRKVDSPAKLGKMTEELAEFIGEQHQVQIQDGVQGEKGYDIESALPASMALVTYALMESNPIKATRAMVMLKELMPVIDSFAEIFLSLGYALALQEQEKLSAASPKESAN